MAKIAFFEQDKWESPELVEYLKASLQKLESKFVSLKMDFYDGPVRKEHLKKIRDCDALVTFINSKVGKNVINAMPHLKYIATMSTGFDHIDLDACAERGIIVSNVPTYGENSVAEHAFALIVTITRRLFDAIRVTRSGKFETTGLRGCDLKGKTIGVIGTGNIGKYVIRIAGGYSMRVIGYDAFPKPELTQELGFEYVDFDTLLEESDIITLHVPFIPSTRHMINREAVKKMKRGVILINTARGGVIDTDALIFGLSQKIIAGVGLDVLEGEDCLGDDLEMLSEEYRKKCELKTVLEDHVLMERSNVFITPHNAFNTTEAIQRIMDTTVENLVRFYTKSPVNVVRKA